MLITGRSFPVESKYLEDFIDDVKYYDFSQIKKNETRNWRIFKEKAKQKEAIAEFSKIALNVKSLNVSNNAIKVLQNPSHEVFNPKFFASIVNYIVEKYPPGGILIFLAGIREINQVWEEIKNFSELTEKTVCFKLHSKLEENFGKVFESIPGKFRVYS